MRTSDAATLLGETKWYAWFIDLFGCLKEYKGVYVLGQYPEIAGWAVATNFTKPELQKLLYRRLVALFGSRRARAIKRGWE